MDDAGTEEPASPKKKSGLPAWFWWTCGTGCLLALVGAGGFALLAVIMGKVMTDPEYMKGKLADVLPCDVWPAGYDPEFGGGVFGIGSYTLIWPSITAGVVIVSTFPGRSELKTALDPSALQNKLPNKELQADQLEIQGRTVDTLQFKDLAGRVHLRVDISGEKPPYAVVELSTREEYADGLEQQTRTFLEPFDVWRGED
jgi:hypothetical protein